MRILGPVASVAIVGGLAKLLYDIHPMHVSGTDVMILMQGLVIWCIAMLADQNSRFHQPKR
jgi:hypothetical protein